MEEQMTAFKKWESFVMQLADVYLPIAPQEKERLQAELSVIEKVGCAERFQAVYNEWQLLEIKGEHCYLTGEAENWFVFYFLDMTRNNPMGNKLPHRAPLKTTFIFEDKVKK